MTPDQSKPSPDLSALAGRAHLLRRSALQTRLRLAEQRAALERLTASLASARAASVRKEAAAVSAPVAASLRAEAARCAPALLHALLPFAVIAAAAYTAHMKIAPSLRAMEAPRAQPPSLAAGHDALIRVVPPAPGAAAPAEDDQSAEALLLVHAWRPPGEERTMLQLLGGELDRPGLPSAWSAERTGPRSYLVRFRDGAAEHAFETDLDARSVRPAESDALFARR